MSSRRGSTCFSSALIRVSGRARWDCTSPGRETVSGALHEAGFTDRLLSPNEGRVLLKSRIGVTNLVNRATASADELDLADYERGARRVEAKIRRYRPRVVAFVGMGAYRAAFGRPRARGGRQAERLAGAEIWVLPNPSGRPAGHQMPALARAFRELRRSLRGGTLTVPGR